MSRRKLSKAANRPPEGSAWVWHTHELIASAAWRGQSINCRRLIDFLECEHLAHGGVENGSLIAPYGQLVQAGITRRLIHETIREAECRGLVSVERGGKRGVVMTEVNRFRLTFFWTKKRVNGLWDWSPPTDEWKSFSNMPGRQRSKVSASIGPTSGTATVPEEELLTVPEGELVSSQATEMTRASQYPKRNCLLDLGEGTMRQHSALSTGAARPEAGASAAPKLHPAVAPSKPETVDRAQPRSTKKVSFDWYDRWSPRTPLAFLENHLPDELKSWAPLTKAKEHRDVA